MRSGSVVIRAAVVDAATTNTTNTTASLQRNISRRIGCFLHINIIVLVVFLIKGDTEVVGIQTTGVTFDTYTGRRRHSTSLDASWRRLNLALCCTVLLYFAAVMCGAVESGVVNVCCSEGLLCFDW